MLGNVKDIKFNVKKQGSKGEYTVTEFTVITDKGDIKMYPVFNNVPYHNLLTQLQVGDGVSLSFSQNGKFKNLSNVERCDVAPAASTNPNVGGGKSYDSGTKDVAIARAVALKAGVESAVALLESGGIKKSIKPQAFVEEVFAMTKRFEGYCSLKDDLSTLQIDSSGVGEGGDFDEAPFPQ